MRISDLKLRQMILWVLKLMKIGSWLMKKLICVMCQTNSSAWCSLERKMKGILPEVEHFFQEDTDCKLPNIEISEEAIKSKFKML